MSVQAINTIFVLYSEYPPLPNIIFHVHMFKQR